MTTTETMTDEQVWALRGEASLAGDLDMLVVCDLALEGDEDAWAECARVISDAEAMED